jgi:hypothetical protein
LIRSFATSAANSKRALHCYNPANNIQIVLIMLARIIAGKSPSTTSSSNSSSLHPPHPPFFPTHPFTDLSGLPLDDDDDKTTSRTQSQSSNIGEDPNTSLQRQVSSPGHLLASTTSTDLATAEEEEALPSTTTTDLPSTPPTHTKSNNIKTSSRWGAIVSVVPKILDTILGPEDEDEDPYYQGGGGGDRLSRGSSGHPSPVKSPVNEQQRHNNSNNKYRHAMHNPYLPSSPKPTTTWAGEEEGRGAHNNNNQQQQQQEEEEERLEPSAEVPPDPTPLIIPFPNHPPPDISEPSTIMTEDDIKALASFVPARYRLSNWKLLYSTARDGISLKTLLRNGKGKHPTILVVRDMGRAVFGAFCSEPWRVNPQQRYYGTGETFVFRLQKQIGVVEREAWPWWWKRMELERNDFFMLGGGGGGGIGVGGAGGYAIWLDSELGSGISRGSGTFGNPALASSEEFKIGAVELWLLD